MTLYRARVFGLYAGAREWSTGYLLNSTAAESTVASAFTAAFGTLWTTATNGYANLCNADVTTTNTVVYTVNPSLVVLSKTTTALSHAGTNAHDSLPFNTAVNVRMLGPSDTKSDRGAMKFPTPSNDMYVGDIFTAAFQTSLKAVLDPFFTSMRALAGYSAVKVNTHTNKQGDPPFTQHIVTTYSVGNKPSAQRARTRKTFNTAFVTGNI